jgi:hypothetical protein
MAEPTVPQNIPERCRSKKYNVTWFRCFTPTLARESRWEACGIRGGDQEPTTQRQPLIQAF